jgi:hypothetical protein
MTKSGLIAFSVTLLCAASFAAAAGPYDGKWQIQTAPGKCTGTRAQNGIFPLNFAANVSGNNLSGSVSTERGASLEGGATIAADGTFTLTVGGTTIIGKFTADKLSITAKSSVCDDRSGTGGRVP